MASHTNKRQRHGAFTITDSKGYPVSKNMYLYAVPIIAAVACSSWWCRPSHTCTHMYIQTYPGVHWSHTKDILYVHLPLEKYRCLLTQCWPSEIHSLPCTQATLIIRCLCMIFASGCIHASIPMVTPVAVFQFLCTHIHTRAHQEKKTFTLNWIWSLVKR